MLETVPFILPPEDEAIARANLARWLTEQESPVEITSLETDRMPGYVMLTATLADGRVVTCLLDLAVRFRDPKAGRDDLWPWGWRA